MTTWNILRLAFGVTLFFSVSTASAQDAKQTARFYLDVQTGPGALFTYADSDACKGITRAASQQWITVEANKVFTFVFSTATSDSVLRYDYCRANASFQPNEGSEYVASLRLDENEKICRIEVVEKRGSEIVGPVSLRLREYKTPFSKRGVWCGADIAQ